jgi:hypothetical protein
MISRCKDPKNESYERYGGRGIKVTDRWEYFANFVQDVGERPNGHSLDRINNDGDYSPENCRWATAKQQANNRASNRLITHNGKTLCITAWSKLLGGKKHLVKNRLRYGWSEADAVSIPARPKATNGTKTH